MYVYRYTGMAGGGCVRLKRKKESAVQTGNRFRLKPKKTSQCLSVTCDSTDSRLLIVLASDTSALCSRDCAMLILTSLVTVVLLLVLVVRHCTPAHRRVLLVAVSAKLANHSKQR